MKQRSLTELANNPDFISGIYSYCDRWCERCPLTSRCLVYATENDDPSSTEQHDTANQQFWLHLASTVQDTKELIAGWARQSGVDLNGADDEEDAGKRKRKTRLIDNHPLARAAKKYATAAADWFKEFDELFAIPQQQPPSERDQERTEQLESARDIIQWYQYQMAVKTMRALSSRNEADDLDPESPKDSDGSAKVALIGIDRSIAAWRLLQITTPESESTIVPLILQLARLRHSIESAFPEARHFIRPGLDEAIAQSH